jgi:hypothetical protein
MTQSWFPNWTEHTLQTHMWFISCIVPYYAVHTWLFTRLKSISDRTLHTLLFAICALPWVALSLLPQLLGESQEWYNAHRWLATDTFQDYLVVMLKFHPIF